MNTQTSYLSFLVQSKWPYLLVAALVGIIFGILLYQYGYQVSWDNWLSVFATVVTFFVAIGLFVYQSHIEWRNSLPLLLSVRFMYEGKVFLLCKNATLAHEADIRNWGQQIGRQMTENSWLNFSPRLDIFSSHKPVFVQGLSYRKFYAQFYLTALPSDPEKDGVISRIQEQLEQFKKGKAKTWDILADEIGDNYRIIKPDSPEFRSDEPMSARKKKQKGKD